MAGVPTVMPGQEGLVRDLFRRVVLEHCAEQGLIAAVSDAFVDDLVDIMLDCENPARGAQLSVSYLLT
jgi:hypothetical protein